VVGEATERGKATCVPGWSTNADSFDKEGAIFSTTKDFIKNQTISVTSLICSVSKFNFFFNRLS
jgi:hypothetical protein